MDPKRQGEIARELVKLFIKKKGPGRIIVGIGKDMPKVIEVVNATRVPFWELMTFVEKIVREVVMEDRRPKSKKK